MMFPRACTRVWVCVAGQGASVWACPRVEARPSRTTVLCTWNALHCDGLDDVVSIFDDYTRHSFLLAALLSVLCFFSAMPFPFFLPSYDR